MKKILAIIFFVAASATVFSQELSMPPNGDNEKASVTQWIGPASITITYHSPDVHGPNGNDRKGHIWGELVPYGFNDLGFGSSKSSPWRAGANENTTITFSNNVKVEGKDLKAGTYGLFLVAEKDKPWTWIFSNNTSSWGSYFYNAKEDALRVDVTPQDATYTEWLTYGFDDRQPKSAVAFLQWENKRIPFKVEVPDVNDLYISKMRDELRGYPGFNYQNWMTAAQFCVQNKVNLNEALTWADNAVALPYIGEENFNTLQTKASVLNALGKNAEAEMVMNKAMNHPTATTQSIHQYGKTLLAEGKNKKALDVFLLNKKLHPEDKFTTYVGLARGYSAVGDKKNAIKNWETAIKNIPEDQKGNLPAYQAEIKKLKG